MTEKAKKTAKITIRNVKDPDGWAQVQDELDLSEAKIKRYFDYREYADLEVELDEDLRVVGGRILPQRR